jgi:hypothetical protein
MTHKPEGVDLQVAWGKCAGNRWCQLNTVDLSNSAFDVGGVYLIWHAGSTPRMVYVGQGAIRERLRDHLDDPRIQAYAKFGLYTTWANVQAAKRDGVEAYLAKVYDPLVGDRRPTAAPIAVNLPWD